MCINSQNHPIVETVMFIPIIVPNIAILYETVEVWSPSSINAN